MEFYAKEFEQKQYRWLARPLKIKVKHELTIFDDYFTYDYFIHKPNEDWESPSCYDDDRKVYFSKIKSIAFDKYRNIFQVDFFTEETTDGFYTDDIAYNDTILLRNDIKDGLLEKLFKEKAPLIKIKEDNISVSCLEYPEFIEGILYD